MLTGPLDPASNREDWGLTVNVLDDSGNAVDVTGATIIIGARSQLAESGDTPDLTLSTTAGTIVISTSTFVATASVSSMRNLDPGNYDVGCTILLAGVTTQLFIGTLAVIDGIVS